MSLELRLGSKKGQDMGRWVGFSTRPK